MGPSGCGKTSLLRAMAGLWKTGTGNIIYYIKGGEEPDKFINSDVNTPLVNIACDTSEDDGKSISRNSRIFFLPQRPYMVLGTLRQQLLYPTWADDEVPSSDSSKQKSMWFQVSFLYIPKYFLLILMQAPYLFFIKNICLLDMRGENLFKRKAWLEIKFIYRKYENI